MPTPFLNRRAALTLSGAFALTGLSGAMGFAATGGERKLLLVILRGALDGLSAVPPLSDPNYASLRGRLAIPRDAALPLSDGFGLHPKLAFLHGRWRAGELAVLHAAASPYRDRSHFDGQDVLESGGERVFAVSDGWLNRALGALPPARKAEGVAIAGTIPLVLRGPAPASSWAPSIAPAADQDTIARLMDLYAEDALLGPALAMAVETNALVGEAGMEGMAQRRGRGFGVDAARAVGQTAAKLMSAPNGPVAGVIALDGWDTHANQGADTGQLANRLEGLDAALAAFQQGMGAQWATTVVIVATEFGRTVRGNGTGGTDHGTGGAAFVLGGAVRGGAMVGDWPGLGALYQNRDLAPANDLRGLFMGVLGPHWGLEPAALSRAVFPNAGGVRRIEGLIRT